MILESQCQHDYEIQHVNIPVEPIENYPMDGLEHAVCKKCGYCLNCKSVYKTKDRNCSP